MTLQRKLNLALLLLVLTSIASAVGLVTQSGPKYFASSSSSSSSSSGGGDVLFSSDLTQPQPLYNFASRYPNNGAANGGNDGLQNCSYSHQATGGRFGGPVTRVTFFEGRWQYNCGYHIPSLGETWSIGDRKYFRFRIRVDDSLRFDHDMPIKLWDDRGHESVGGTRSILYFSPPYDIASGGGKLGGYDNVDTPPENGGPNQRVIPPWWGLAGNRGSWVTTYSGLYGSLSIGVGVGLKYTDPILISYGNRASVPANPNSTSQSDVGGWLEGQIEMVCDDENSRLYAFWLNNNDYANPSSYIRVFVPENEDPGLTCTGWSNTSFFPAWMDGGSGTHAEHTFYLDIENVEIGTSFDNEWFRE